MTLFKTRAFPLSIGTLIQRSTTDTTSILHMASLTAPILARASVCTAAARARQQPATTSRVARADPIRRTTFLGRGAGQLSPLGRKVRARPPTDPPRRTRPLGWRG